MNKKNKERIQYSAWGIVVDPKNQKILITKKLSKSENIWDIIQWLFRLFKIQPEDIIQKYKWWITKGKINKWYSNEECARKEIEEEGWINRDDLILIKKLWIFTKRKKYGIKKIDMFLYIIDKEYNKLLQPSDRWHIAAFIDIEKIPKVIQSKKEKEFFAYIQKDVEEIINIYTSNTLFITDKNNVT